MLKRIPVIVFGVGGVGQALLEQIVNGRSRAAERNQCQFDVVAVVDSRTVCWNLAGMPDDQLFDIMARKQQGLTVDESAKLVSPVHVLNQAHTIGVEGAIVVDVTAVDGMEPLLDHALALGYSVALANKKAFAGPWHSAKKYFNHPRIRHESTVGGGQPVIATLRYLLDVNDPIYRIEGQLSGTLGFICGQLDAGMPFSQAVAAAKAKGFTEPDPREDLGGQDVMRKVMILGRMAGWPLTATDIEVESLYPAEMAELSVADFMATAERLDEAMKARVETAAAEGNVLRYVATLHEGGGVVGLQPLPAASPLAHLKYISFQTQRYNDEALLIGGKGAGVEMTAAGVIGDMFDLVREHH